MNCNDQAIREVVIAALERIAPDADLSSLPPTESIREVLEIDSYDFLRFLIALNKQLGVEIPEADYGKLQTLADLTAYLRAHCDDAKPA
jgi:acyl carrier protein